MALRSRSRFALRLPLLRFPTHSSSRFFDPDPAPQASAQQGASVASDGHFVVVGAPLDDIDGYDVGLVKVYHAATGALLHTLANHRPTQSDYFGNAVAISGSRVVVGARATVPDVEGEMIVGWERLELSTNALKGRCSTIELPTLPEKEGGN